MNTTEAAFEGYHRFIHHDGLRPICYGSFEVFYVDGQGPRLGSFENDQPATPGYYWWSCHRGCLPDGEPSGPFPTSEGAYLDAIGD